MADKSKLRTMLSEGAIAEFYTLEGYFCKIKPCLSIDKVLFDFVEKGTNGKGFEVYVNTDNFDSLCDEILNERLRNIINNEQSSYPSSWIYITGENGSKYVAIGKGNSQPIVIQGRDSSLKLNAFVGVANYDALKTMAKWWKRISKTYYEELVNLFLQGYNDSQSHYQGKSEELSSTDSSKSPDIYSLKAVGDIQESNGNFKLLCTDGNRNIEVIFLDGFIKKNLDKFNAFMEVLMSGVKPSFRIQAMEQLWNNKPQLRFMAFPTS